MKQSNVVELRCSATGSHLSPSGCSLAHSLLIKLRDESKQRIVQYLRELFNNADDALFAMADRSGTNGDQTHYFDAMRELRLQKKHIAKEVLKGLVASFDKQIEGDARKSSQDIISSLDDISLIDKDDMEIKVAVEGMVGRVRSASGNVLEELRHRYESVSVNSTLLSDQMPASPEIICEHFVQGMDSLDVSIRARLVILKLFEQHVLSNMASMYEEANTTFIKQGILPDLKPYEIQSTRTASRQASSENTSTFIPVSSEMDSENVPTLTVSFGGSLPIDSPNSQDLHGLLHSARNASTAAEPPVLALGHYAQQDIISSLSVVQAEHYQLINQGIDAGSLDLRAELVNRLSAQNETSATFREVDEDVIHLVSMLFEFILDDRQLQPAMKALIARLQIPILKVALLDRSFFSKGGHPARQLLNLIASAALGWTAPPEGKRDPLRHEIESIIETILNEFEDRVDLFSELLASFKVFVDKDERRRLLVERRISDAEQGKAANEAAQQQVHSTIKGLVGERALPDSTQALLQEGINRAMLLTLLKSGDNSEEWKELVLLAKQLIESVSPATINENTRTNLLGMIPKLVTNVRRILKETAADEFVIDEWMSALESDHIKTLGRIQFQLTAQKEVLPPASQSKDLSSSNSDLTLDVVERADGKPEQSSASDPLLSQVDKFTVGCWFELTVDERAERCKLAAVIKVTGKYIFVNRSGVKIAERSREELANDLRQGQIQVLNDGLLFDRALESVITSLRDQQ